MTDIREPWNLTGTQRRQFREAQIAAKAARHGYRRHPAEVTSDRLGDAVGKWHGKFSGEERDMVAQIRQRLEEIAEEAGSDSAITGRAY